MVDALEAEAEDDEDEESEEGEQLVMTLVITNFITQLSAADGKMCCAGSGAFHSLHKLTDCSHAGVLNARRVQLINNIINDASKLNDLLLLLLLLQALRALLLAQMRA
jgi:hypothetical protein